MDIHDYSTVITTHLIRLGITPKTTSYCCITYLVLDASLSNITKRILYIWFPRCIPFFLLWKRFVCYIERNLIRSRDLVASEISVTHKSAEISRRTSLKSLCLSLNMRLLVRLRMPVSLVRSLPSNSATLTIGCFEICR